MLKRQRELKQSEKAAKKRAKRHGIVQGELVEPRATDAGARIFGLEGATEPEGQDSDDPNPQPEN